MIKTLNLFLCSLTLVCFNTLLATDNDTDENLVIAWEIQDGVSFIEGFGFMKEYGSGWEEGIAITSPLEIGDGISLSFLSENWPMHTPFKIGISNSEEYQIDDCPFIIYYDGIQFILDGIEIFIDNLNTLEIQLHPDGQLVFYEDEELLYSTASEVELNENSYIHMALEEEQDIVEMEIFFNHLSFATTPPVQPCSNLNAYKYTESLTYSENGILISHALEVKDNFGIPSYVMKKNIEENTILTKAILKDKHGRPALESLEAPIGNTFCLDEGFMYPQDFQVNENSIQMYNWENFDQDGNNPEVVSPYSTLGAYYSGENSGVSQSELPFVRKFYSDNILQEVVSSAGYHPRFFEATNRVYAFNTVSHTELYNVYGLRGSYLLDDQLQTLGINNVYATKQISVNANEEALITYKNLKGQLLATALSGASGNSCALQTNKLELQSGVSTTIHVPMASINDLAIDFPDPSHYYDNAAAGAYPLDAFDLLIYDKLTNTILIEGTDYNLNADATNRTMHYVELLGDRATKMNVLSISLKHNALAETIWSNFSAFLNLNLRAYLYYKTDYTHWTLSYFDEKGNLVKAIQPEGTDCNLDASSGSHDIEVIRGQHKVNQSSGATIFSMDIHPVSGYTNNVQFSIKPSWLIEAVSSGAYEVVEPADPGSINKTSAFEESTVAIASLEEGLTNNNYPLYIPNPKDPLIQYDMQPTVPPGAIERTFSRATKFTLGVYGTTGVGSSPTLLKLWEYKLTRHQTFYYVIESRNGSNYLRQLGWASESITRERQSTYPTQGTWETLNYDSYIDAQGEQVPGTWYKLDDWDASSIDFSSYSEVQMRIYNPKQHERFYTSASNNTNYFPIATEPAYESFSKFSFLGNVGASFTYTPPLPDHSDALSEQYDYNEEDQLIEKELPDEGSTQYVYSSKGLPKFTQTAAQEALEQFSYVLYDNWDRPVESGVYIKGIVGGPSSGNTIVNLIFSNTDPENSSTTYVYNLRDVNTPLNSGQCTEQSYTLYDVAASDMPSLSSIFTQKNLAGRISKTWNNYHSTWYSYDYEGKLVSTVSQTTALGVKTVRYVYNELKQLTLIAYDELGTKPYYIKYAYDDNGQVVTIKASQYMNHSYEVLAEYSYDVHGKPIHNTLGDGLQGIDYHYTVESKLKSINNALNPSSDKDVLSVNNHFADLFAETLHYYEGDYRNEHTSILSTTDASMPNDPNLLVKGSTWYTHEDISLSHNLPQRSTYSYAYDSEGQLSSALYGTVQAGTDQPVAFTKHGGNKYRIDYTYDLNGNITTMWRRAYGGTNLIDNLSYHYPQDAQGNKLSNKLQYINDDVGGTQFADELTTQSSSNNYQYDASGRLIKDAERDVSISYNEAGLVTEVKTHDENSLRELNFYNEQNFLIEKRSYSSSGSVAKIQYWACDANGQPYQHYEQLYSPTAQNIQLKEGYVYNDGRLATVDLSGSKADYSYELKDHIGNVRASFKENKVEAEVYDFTEGELHEWVADSDEENYVSEEGLLLIGKQISLFKEFYLSEGRYNLEVQLAEAFIQPLLFTLTNLNGDLIATQTVEAQSLKQFSFYVQEADDYQITISNADAELVELMIANVTLTKSTLSILQYADYYPFGWELPGRTYTASNANAEHGYQGDYARTNAELNWVSFQLRNYDARVGRWLSVDPANQYYSAYKAMGNNPISIFDPDGAFAYLENDEIWFRSYNFIQNNLLDVIDGKDMFNDGGDICETCPDKPEFDEARNSIFDYTYNPETGEATMNDLTNGGTLAEATVTDGQNWTSETSRYEYGGDYASWNAQHGDAWRSNPNAASDWQNQVAMWDQQERDRVNLQKLSFFVDGFTTAGAMGMGAYAFGGSSYSLSPRSFNYVPRYQNVRSSLLKELHFSRAPGYYARPNHRLWPQSTYSDVIMGGRLHWNSTNSTWRISSGGYFNARPVEYQLGIRGDGGVIHNFIKPLR